MDHKGCQVLLIIIAIGVLLGMVIGSAPMFRNQGGAEPGSEKLFSALGTDFTFTDIQKRYEFLAAQQRLARGTLGGDAGLYGQSIMGLVNDAAVAQIANERGVVMNEALARKSGEDLAKNEWANARIQLITTGKIKPTASEAEADKALEQQVGKSKDTFIKDIADLIMERYSNPETAAETTSELLVRAVQDSYLSSTTYSEQELKAAFDDFTFDVIRFDDPAKPLPELGNVAQKALDEIKAGKPFAEVQKMYSAGKKPEDLKATLTRGALESGEPLSKLAALKPGEVSDVVTAGSPTIYRLVSTKQNLPKDFEATKARLLESSKQQKATQTFTKDVRARAEGADVKFQDPGTKALYDLMKIVVDQTKLDKTADCEALYNQIRGQDLAKVARVDFLAYAELATAMMVWQNADAAKKKEFGPDWVDTVERSFQFGEDLGMRIQLAEVQLEQGQNEEAASSLEQAIGNCADYDQTGQAIYTRVSATTKAAFESKKFTGEQRDAIQKKLDEWLEHKIEEDKRLADEKAEQARIQKELDDEAKKAKEEADKEAAKGNSGKK